MRNAGLDELQAGINIGRRNINSLRYENQIRSDQLLSHVRFFATPWIARPPCPSPTPGVHWDSCPLSWWCHPTILSSVAHFSCPQLFPASGSFPMTFRIRWPKYWSFSSSPSDEYSGLISFRIGRFDLLAVQGILKSFLQYHSLKASVLQRSANSHIHSWLLKKT